MLSVCVCLDMVCAAAVLSLTGYAMLCYACAVTVQVVVCGCMCDNYREWNVSQKGGCVQMYICLCTG